MSQQSTPVLTLSAQAVGAIACFRGVGFNGVQASVAGQKIMGIAYRPAASGEWLPVVALGTVACEAGAAVAIGSAVVMDSAGRVVTAAALTVATGAVAVTSAAANGAGTIAGSEPPQFIVGYALQAANAAGDFIEVLVK